METTVRGLTVRFWGTRGSLPAPGPQTAGYGGNTSCVEVRAGEQIIILDGGSGLRPLGNELVGSPGLKIHLLFSHYHWDHIMGLPFFAPLYAAGNTVTLHGEARDGRNPLEILSNQTVQPYFPVSILTESKAALTAHAISPTQGFELGDVKVSCVRLNHPGDAVAYRLDYDGRSLVYATDTEPDSDLDARLVEFSGGADALIYDSTYTDREYEKRLGWGHSTWRVGCSIADRAGVRQLILFHHLPERADREIAVMEQSAKNEFGRVLAAREGMILEFPA